MSEQNKATARRLLDEVWSKGNLDVIDEVVDASYVFRDPAVPGVRGPEGLKQLVLM